MVQNGVFWTIGEQSYPIISYRRIKVYRVKKWIWEDLIGKTVSLGIFSCPKVLHYLMYEIRYFGRIPTMIYVCMWNHTLNNVRFLVSGFSKEHGHLVT